MEPAICPVCRGGEAKDVISAVFANHAAERVAEVAGVDDGESAGGFGQPAQVLHAADASLRHLGQRVRIGDHLGRNVAGERQPRRIQRIDRHVPPRCRGDRCVQIFDGQAAGAAVVIERLVDAGSQPGGDVDDGLAPAADAGHEFDERPEAPHPLAQEEVSFARQQQSILVQRLLLGILLLLDQLSDLLSRLYGGGTARACGLHSDCVDRSGFANGGGRRPGGRVLGACLLDVARTEAPAQPVD